MKISVGSSEACSIFITSLRVNQWPFAGPNYAKIQGRLEAVVVIVVEGFRYVKEYGLGVLVFDVLEKLYYWNLSDRSASKIELVAGKGAIGK